MVLLGKWKWKLGKEDPSLWKEILNSKYGSRRALDEAKDSKLESWWWRDIKKLCGKGTKNNWFNKNLRWNKGKGNKIKFWNDTWRNVIKGKIPEVVYKCNS